MLLLHVSVALHDRAYYVSIADSFPLSASTSDSIRSADVEPRLAANDWAGAAIVLANGLRTGESARGSGAVGGVPIGVLVVGGAAVVGGGVYMQNRRRRRRAGAPAW